MPEDELNEVPVGVLNGIQDIEENRTASKEDIKKSLDMTGNAKDTEYNFRNANSKEKESYITYLVESVGYTREIAEDIVDVAHVGMLEDFQGTTPSYVGKLLIVFHQNTSMHEVYQYSDKGDLQEVRKERMPE